MVKLIINFGVSDGKKTFKSKDELLKFLTDQKSFWQTFFSGAQHPLNTFNNHITNQIDRMVQNANAVSETNDSQSQSSLDYISNLFAEMPIAYSEGKAAKFVQQIKQKDQNFARYMVGYFIKQLYNMNNDPLAFRAIFEGMKFDSGITSNIDAEKEALGALKSEWDDNLTALRSAFEEANSQVVQTQDTLNTYYTHLQTQFDEFKTEKENQFKKVIETYDQKLALQAPVEYWSERSSLNYFWALILGIIFFTSMIIVIGNFEPMAKDVSNALDEKNYYPLLQFATLAVLGLWLLRIIVKIFYSKLHLAEEAKEKEMFIKTYLSLLRDTDGVKEEDRHLILQSIFAPSKNGIIQDDGLPMNVIENIVKARS